MRPIRVFVVDDEAPARRKVLRFLKDDAEVTVVGEAANGADAVAAITAASPDLVFLDVQMPGMGGFEVVRQLDSERMPRIVFVTAHDQYAIQAFDVHAFGYLLKPFDQPRFSRVLAKVKEQIAKESPPDLSESVHRLLAEIGRRQHAPQRLLVEQGERAFFISPGQIDWIESERNYLKLHVGPQEFTIRGTLNSLADKLDTAQFLRINRSSMVRVDFIRELEKWFHGEYKVILQSGTTLMWTRRYINQESALLQKL